MSLSLRRRAPREPDLPGVRGAVRIDQRTKQLTKRLRLGDIAVIDHQDIDNALLESDLVRNWVALPASATIEFDDLEVGGKTIALLTRVASVAAKHLGKPLPRPSHWGGYLMRPDRVEFWRARPSRLHERILFRRAASRWHSERLQP